MFANRELREEEVAYLNLIRGRLKGEEGDRAAYYATTLMERGLPVIFDVNHLSHITTLRPNVIATLASRPDLYYSVFRIPKRAGGSREIAAPRPALKHVQTWIHRQILSQLSPHPACNGFVTGRSIVTNAEPHVGNRIVLKLDLRDFFPSVTREAVFRIFRRIGYSPDMADLLTSLTTLTGTLPQGAPTSPQLANLAAFGLDVRLAGLAAKRGFVYTRYADDLTFSGDVIGQWSVKRLVERIIREAGFRPNERKARYLPQHRRQAVTGVIVNEKVNWPRPTRRWLRQEVYYLRTRGFDEHVRWRGITQRAYKEFLYGHIYALNMTRPEEAQHMLGDLALVDWPY